LAVGVSQGDRSGRRPRPEQVPTIAGDIDEDNNVAVRFPPRFGDELHARLAHPLICGVEVLDAQKQPDAPRELIADGSSLSLAIGSGEE
jgi:hypothetical protein